MKIAISAGGNNLDSDLDPRFGRCRYFIVADLETGDFEIIDNSSALSSGGAGIAAAQLVAGYDVKAVLTGNCGPNAYNTLSAAGIDLITGLSGKISDIIENYRSGNLKTTYGATVPDHFGMNLSPGRVGEPGVGRGMGLGVGRGKGMRRGMGMGGGVMPQYVAPVQGTENEIQALKAESQMMAKRLTEIQNRISALENRKD